MYVVADNFVMLKVVQILELRPCAYSKHGPE